MTWKPGDYCMFTTPKGHPQDARKIGKIIEISSPYFQGKEHYQNVVIEDSLGKWELKLQINHTERNQWDLSGISGVHPDIWHSSKEEKKYHQKDFAYFKNLFPNQLKLSYYVKENIQLAREVLKPLTKDYLEREICIISDLEQMIKIYSKLMYSCPITLKLNDDNYTNADSKQSCYYVTKDTFEDIVYQPKLAWESRVNRNRGSKEHISHPRQILSDNRIEELQIAIILISEKISDAIDFGICGDEDVIEEIDYIELLKEADRIRQRTVDLH